MRILSIETSTMMGGVAVMDSATGLLAEVRAGVRAGHSEKLMAWVDQALKGAGLGLKDIDALAVAVGPGSFTGLRIGLGTAKGLAFATGLKVVAVPTLEAFALSLASFEMPVCPMLDARKKEVYAGLFRNEEGGPVRLLPETSIRAGQMALKLRQYGRVLFAGEGAALYREEIAAAVGEGGAVFLPPPLGAPTPLSVAVLGLKKAMAGEFVEPAALVPFYIRKSEAELKAP